MYDPQRRCYKEMLKEDTASGGVVFGIHSKKVFSGEGAKKPSNPGKHVEIYCVCVLFFVPLSAAHVQQQPLYLLCSPCIYCIWERFYYVFKNVILI